MMTVYNIKIVLYVYFIEKKTVLYKIFTCDFYVCSSQYIVAQLYTSRLKYHKLAKLIRV